MPFTDAEAAAVDIISADPAVAALGAVTVTTGMIGYTAGARWVRVTRTGGIPLSWMNLDPADLRVESYGADKPAAYDLAVAARDALFAARGVYSGNGMLLHDIADGDGLSWQPDDARPGAARYVFTVVMIGKPL